MSPRRFIATALVGLATPFAQALPSHTFAQDLSSPLAITAVASHGVARVLDGARATAFFSDGSSAQALFVGSESGLDQASVAQAAGRFAVVAVSSGSLVSAPEFSILNFDPTLTLMGFRLDGRGDGDGHAAFDRGLGLSSTGPSTDGSAAGIDLTLSFKLRTFITGHVHVAYSHPLGLNAADPVGDLFSTVDVSVSFDTLIGIPPTTSFSGVFSRFDFSADLDFVDYAAVTAPPPDGGTVPEPASLALVALVGLVGLTARLGRRARIGTSNKQGGR